MTHFKTRRWTERPHHIAPDGSEIRELMSFDELGGLAHAQLAPGKTSSPVSHKTVSEIWYCIAGEGTIWRRSGEAAVETPLAKGVAVTIPQGVEFQFRSSGKEPLELLIATMPPWPLDGSDALDVKPPYWTPSVRPPVRDDELDKIPDYCEVCKGECRGG